MKLDLGGTDSSPPVWVGHLRRSLLALASWPESSGFAACISLYRDGRRPHSRVRGDPCCRRMLDETPLVRYEARANVGPQVKTAALPSVTTRILQTLSRTGHPAQDSKCHCRWGTPSIEASRRAAVRCWIEPQELGVGQFEDSARRRARAASGAPPRGRVEKHGRYAPCCPGVARHGEHRGEPVPRSRVGSVFRGGCVVDF